MCDASIHKTMSQERSCPQCSSVVPHDARVCPHCGTQLSKTAVVPTGTTLSAMIPSFIRNSRQTTIFLVVSILVLVIGGTALVTWTSRRSPVAPLVAPTASVTSLPPSPTAIRSVDSQSTSSDTVSVTQTAQARTAQALVQMAATQTATALQAELTALFANAQRVFYDEFVDNRNAWFIGVFQDIELNLIEDGVFKVLWSGKNTSYEVYELSSFTDFIGEVDCRIARGGGDGSCGLIFAQQRNVGFYKFEFFIDYYRLSIILAEGEPVILAEGDPHRITTVGDQNRLRVIRQGERIRLFINDALAADLRDNTLGAGRVGVSTACYNTKGGVEVHFDNFGIWSLASGS
mgnify:FL=1